MRYQKQIIYLSIICSIIWFFATPYIDINNMYKAANEKNATLFSTYIDYSKLKENLKISINNAISKELSNTQTPNSASISAATLATTLINPIIDNMITPENVTSIMRGRPTSTTNSDEEINVNIQNDQLVKSMYYKNFNTFIVSIKNNKNPNKPIELTFTRTSIIKWQLTAIQLI